MIRVVNVTHHYGIRPVLRNVNLEVRPGEMLCVMGPNGMGKTTLLNVAAGILWPIRGYTEIGGKLRRGSVEEEIAIREMVFYLPDHPWLPATASGREYLVNIGKIYSIDDDRLLDHIYRLLLLFELAALEDAPIASYSNGQKKKIAVAGALVSEAPVMIMDEPFSGGMDPSALFSLKQVMQHLARREDVTILMATPVPELVEGLAHRIAILRGGEIVACDTPDALRRLAGCRGPLEEVLEKLINPETMEHIEEYIK